MGSTEMTIVDSHIHLYAKTHLPGLNWSGDLPSDHVLNRQNSVEQYRQATADDPNLRGFVFLETDRKFSHDESGWKDPLEEVAFLARIAQGRPIEGEGHVAADSRLVLGIVPWAPLPAGPEMLEKYVSQVKDVCDDERTFNLIKGYRYLVQDKPAGTMLQPNFIEGLKWLGENNLSFDLGVDLRQGGIHQLREARTMLDQVFADRNNLKVIINHCCKPNLHVLPEEVESNADFISWSECIKAFSAHPTTYMKLSGLFSELPPQEEGDPALISQLVQQVKPWTDVVFAAFGPSRIMFGSDWPVCSAGGPGSKAWQHWVQLVTAILEAQELNLEEKQGVWSGTAVEAYGITISTAPDM